MRDRYRVLIASFGFDIDFVMRKLANREYSKIVLLALYTSDEAFKRVEKAYHTLSVACKSLGVDCILEKIEPEKLIRSLSSTLRANVEDPRVERVEVYLTGGPRILVTALVLSTLLLPSTLAERVEISVEGEGFECEARVDLAKYAELVRLDERDKKIVFELQARGPQKLSELESSTEIPRSTLYRRLEELREKRLVEKEEDEYRLVDIASVVCRT